MKRVFVGLATVLSLALSLSAAARGIDVDKVNGSIHIDGDQQAGDLSTVNGSIRIESGGSAKELSTVNGGIEVGDRVTVESIETVNGGIEVGAGSHVARTIEAVNGHIELGRDADVAGKTSNVNGRISLDAAHVGGGIETVSGDIEVGANSRVEGGILVDKPHGFSWGKSKNPRVVIGPHAVVDGTLEFRREVDLYVSDSAKVGTITGATAKKFSGDHP
ncbi:MAG TPA: hypothetical protein VHC92_12050 [Rhodanobacteraceae bacterium]|jgi:hypothetical protein|nr:hypothetical protein [Rhodanobacteraceae bacterium]